MTGVASDPRSSNIHAGAVLLAGRAVLVCGPSGAGKSSLCALLIDHGAHLIADDRVILEATHGRLIARPVPNLAGLLELRGRGLVRMPHERAGVVALVVAIEDCPERMPEDAALHTDLLGVSVPRQPVPADPLRAVPLIDAAIVNATGAVGNAVRSRPASCLSKVFRQDAQRGTTGKYLRASIMTYPMATP